jgi:hypothetical protein
MEVMYFAVGREANASSKQVDMMVGPSPVTGVQDDSSVFLAKQFNQDRRVAFWASGCCSVGSRNNGRRVWSLERNAGRNSNPKRHWPVICFFPRHGI